MEKVNDETIRPYRSHFQLILLLGHNTLKNQSNYNMKIALYRDDIATINRFSKYIAVIHMNEIRMLLENRSKFCFLDLALISKMKNLNCLRYKQDTNYTYSTF